MLVDSKSPLCCSACEAKDEIGSSDTVSGSAVAPPAAAVAASSRVAWQIKEFHEASKEKYFNRLAKREYLKYSRFANRIYTKCHV